MQQRQTSSSPPHPQSLRPCLPSLLPSPLHLLLIHRAPRPSISPRHSSCRSSPYTQTPRDEPRRGRQRNQCDLQLHGHQGRTQFICISPGPWSEGHCWSVHVGPLAPSVRSWQSPVTQLRLRQRGHGQAADELADEL